MNWFLLRNIAKGKESLNESLAVSICYTWRNKAQISYSKTNSLKLKLTSVRWLPLHINTFHSGVRDTRTFMPTHAYRCTSILILAIPCQQLPPGARTPACTVGCQRLPPANANSRLAEQEARGCSKSQIANITFIIGIHSRSGQQKKPWPKMSMKNKNFHRWYLWPKMTKIIFLKTSEIRMGSMFVWHTNNVSIPG